MPSSSAAGMTSRRKAINEARRSSAVTPSYSATAARIDSRVQEDSDAERPAIKRALQALDFLRAHPLEALSRSLDPFRRVAALSIPSLEDEQIISGEIESVETHGVAGGRKLPGDVRPNPVDHRHEVVADGFDSGAGDGRHGVDPVPDIAAIRSGAKLDGVVRRNALDHGPLQTGGGNFVPAAQNFVSRPCLAAITDDAARRRFRLRQPARHRPAAQGHQGRTNARSASSSHSGMGRGEIRDWNLGRP